MFREMRRKKQQLSQKEIQDILDRGTCGVLAAAGDEGYPYAVPLSYVYDGNHIYFHGARSGHKVDAIRRSDKVSFCVIDQDMVVPEEFTTYFRSVIAFGRIRIVEDADQKRRAAEKLAEKYSPRESWDRIEQEISGQWKALCVMEMKIEHISGKEAIELVRQKTAACKQG